MKRLTEFLLLYGEFDEYAPSFRYRNVMIAQLEVLRAQQCNRDAIDGRLLPSKRVARHHYKHIKADCRIEALVAIKDAYNRIVEAKQSKIYWERTLEIAKTYFKAGRAPKHWNIEYRKAFRLDKRRQFRDALFYYT